MAALLAKNVTALHVASHTEEEEEEEEVFSVLFSSLCLSFSLSLFQLHVCMICCIFPDLAHHFAIGKIGLFQYLSICHEWWNLIDTSFDVHCFHFTVLHLSTFRGSPNSSAISPKKSPVSYVFTWRASCRHLRADMGGCSHNC